MKKYRLNKMKFARFILLVIVIMLVAWFAVSYAEILTKNLNTNVHLTEWNLWTVMEKIS